VRAADRHLALHVGGSLGAVTVAAALPPLAAWLLGAHWAWLLLPLALAPLAWLGFFVAKVARWTRAPVPFRVPLTAGQQRGLPGLPRQRWANPHAWYEVAIRFLLDACLFRPLFRTTPTATRYGGGLSHGMGRGLWLAAAAFHGALLVVLLRHLRMVLEPVPGFVTWLENVDAATEMWLPKLHVTTVVLAVALLVLLGRRLALPRVRYLSLAADYFPLFLLLAIATTGIVMRHFTRTDVAAVKDLALGLAHGRLVLPPAADLWLVAHLFCVGVLLVYFPLGKLMHAPGVLLCPTLTLANDNRQRRHINPRNPQVEVLHYDDYENAFRDRMIEAGLPVEKG
jgi:nitrate reductase gamma subunit